VRRGRGPFRATIVQCDLREPDTIRAVVDRAKAELGTIDVPVNNAGTSWGASVTDYPDLDRAVERLGLPRRLAHVVHRTLRSLASWWQMP
jgi:NAD(P)-dependent dehydrogenase (short-subunit alcohol dehydrogenase family)